MAPDPSSGAIPLSGQLWRAGHGTGYTGDMTENQQEPRPGQEPSDAERDLAAHERPERGLIADQDLPEDVRPGDDNPLAKGPDEDEQPSGPGPFGE